MFSTYRKGNVTLDMEYIAKAMYSESVLPFAYDYRDPQSNLSFQLISPTYALIADPDFPVVKQILAAEWQIQYAAGFSGVGNVRFVAKGLDASLAANWKTINDVLQQYNFAGQLPIVSLAQVYMLAVRINDSKVITGTLFTPSQPYVSLSLTGTPPTLTVGTERTVPYNNVAETIGVEESDSAQIVAVTSGADTGKLQLSVAGVYMIRASFGVQTSGVATITSPVFVQLKVLLNGTNIAESFGAIGQFGTIGDGVVQITTLARINKAQLVNSQKAVLEIRAFAPGSSGSYVIDASPSSSFTVFFLG